MKKVLLFVGLVLLLLGAAVYVHREEIAMLVAFNKLKPAAPFSSALTPPSPDYSLPANWAVLPDRDDDADTLPAMDVVAYPIGFSLDAEELARSMPDVPVCESEEQIGLHGVVECGRPRGDALQRPE